MEPSDKRRFKEVLLHFRQHKEVITKVGDKTELNYVLKNNGGYTVLVRKQEGVFVYTVARCGKADNFNRGIGAAIARGRFECKDKDRRQLLAATTQQLMLHELKRLTHKTKETYSPEFLELLLQRLV